MESPYETLGVETNATKAQIEKAYRDKARKTHPDHGGDSEEFKKITKAREILVCDKRRKRFDETGGTDYHPKAAVSAAETMVAGMTQEAFMQDNAPPVRWMCDRIDKKRYETSRAVEQAKKQREKLERKIAKFASDNKSTKNKQGFEFVTGVLQAGMANLDHSIAVAESDIATCTEALVLLNDLRSEQEFSPFGVRQQSNGWASATSYWIPGGQ